MNSNIQNMFDINQKKIDVLIPIYNEEKYLHKLINSLENIDKDGLDVCFYFIDGCSNDNSLKVLNEILINSKLKYKIKINNNKTVPYALNLGIRSSNADLIIRLDAHCEFPRNYFKKCIQNLYSYKAENSGGAWINTPANETLQAKCIAISLGSMFAVGQAKYRIYGEECKDIFFVDTVPFGVFKTSIFKEIGLFDEDLTRNQDDEFNARIKKKGYRIVLDKSIKIKYYCRPNIFLLSKMFYQYGLFKPLAALKLRKVYTFRQLVPFLSLFTFLSTLCLSIIDFKFIIPLVTLTLIYILISIFVSTKLSIKNKLGFLGIIILLISFICIHLSYAIGYFMGILKIIFFNKAKLNVNINR